MSNLPEQEQKQSSSPSPFTVRTGDVKLFNHDCLQMRSVFGWAVCRSAKERGTPYDHVGIVVVQPEKEQQQKAPATSAAGAEEPKQDPQQTRKTNHVASTKEPRAQVLDALFRGVVVRSVDFTISRKYNHELKLRYLLTEMDDGQQQQQKQQPDFDQMRAKCNESNGFRYKRKLLHFLSGAVPAFPDRRDAAAVLAERMLRERFALSLEQEKQQGQVPESPSCVFDAVVRRRQTQLRQEVLLLHRAYAARRAQLERSAWRIVAGLNDAGTRDAGYFCSEATGAVLQAGRVLGRFPSATCFSPSDFACNAQAMGPQNPHPRSYMALDVHACLSPAVEIKPTSPERGVDFSSSGRRNKMGSLLFSPGHREPAAAAALSHQLAQRYGDDAPSSIATSSFEPRRVEEGQILWLDHKTAQVPAVFTGNVACVLVQEGAATAATASVVGEGQQQDDSNNKKNDSRSNNNNVRDPPLTCIAHPPANSLFTADQVAHPSRSRWVGLLVKGNGTVWTCPDISSALKKSNSSSNSNSHAPSSLLRTLSGNEKLLSSGKEENVMAASSSVYVVVEGSVEDPAAAGRRYFAGDVVGGQELLARSAGAFPQDRLGGWENDMLRDSALQRPWCAPESPLLRDPASPSSPDPARLVAGRGGAVVAAVSASEVLPGFAAPVPAPAAASTTVFGSTGGTVPAREFHVVASLAGTSDASFRVSLADAELLLFGSSAAASHVDGALRQWLFFEGRRDVVVVGSRNNNSNTKNRKQLSSSRLATAAGKVDFDDVMRAVDSLQKVADLSFAVSAVAGNEGGAEDVVQNVQKMCDSEIFVEVLLAPLLVALTCRGERLPIGVEETNAALSSALSIDGAFINSTCGDADSYLLTNRIVGDLRSGRLMLSGEGTELVRQLQRLAKQSLTSDGAESQQQHAFHLSSLLSKISGGWSARNALVDASTGLAISPDGDLVNAYASVSPGQAVLRLWLAVLSGSAASSMWMLRRPAPGSAAAASLSHVGFCMNVNSFLLRAFVARAVLACTLHSVLLFGALKWMSWQEERRRARILKKSMKWKNSKQNGDDGGADEGDISVVAVTHPRWKCFKAAAYTGLAASLMTLPLESAAFRIAYLREVKGMVPKRALFVWTLLSAAPYVGGAQWLYAHELLLPMGMLSPATSPSFLFPQFDAECSPAAAASSAVGTFYWLSPGSSESMNARVMWVGLSMTGMMGVLYPLGRWRERGLVSNSSPGRLFVEKLRTDGAMSALRDSYRGFGVAMRQMTITNIVSYTLFAASVRVVDRCQSA